MKVKSESEVAQSCPTLSDPMDRSLPGSFDHGIFQVRALEWDAIAFSCIHNTKLQIGHTENTKEQSQLAFFLLLSDLILGVP